MWQIRRFSIHVGQISKFSSDTGQSHMTHMLLVLVRQDAPNNCVTSFKLDTTIPLKKKQILGAIGSVKYNVNMS
jgi:hypothetical protein